MSDDITTWPFGLVTKDKSACLIPFYTDRELTDEFRAELIAKAAETAELSRGRRLAEPVEPTVETWAVHPETREPVVSCLRFAMTEPSR